MIPRRRVWSTPFGQEFGRALTGLAVGFFVAFMLCGVRLIASHGGFMQGPPARRLLEMASFASMAMLWGCVVAVLPMAMVMALERRLRIDLGSAAWTCIGIGPTMALSLLVAGREAMALPPAMFAGGFAAAGAHLLRTTASRAIEPGEWVETIAICTGMLLVSWVIALG